MCLNTTFLVGLQYNFSGVTITGGREGGTVGGGGIIGGELNNSLTLSGVRISNNQDANSGLGGGGIQITGGSLTITNSLIGGTSPPCTAASPTCASGTDRNNINLANSAQTSGGGVNYTPSSPMHTGGTGTLTVTGTDVHPQHRIGCRRRRVRPVHIRLRLARRNRLRLGQHQHVDDR